MAIVWVEPGCQEKLCTDPYCSARVRARAREREELAALSARTDASTAASLAPVSVAYLTDRNRSAKAGDVRGRHCAEANERGVYAEPALDQRQFFVWVSGPRGVSGHVIRRINSATSVDCWWS